MIVWIIIIGLISLVPVNNEYLLVNSNEIEPFVDSNETEPFVDSYELNQPLNFFMSQSKHQRQFHAYLTFLYL